MSFEVFIDDQRIELRRNQSTELVSEVANLATLDSRQGKGTSRFSAPLTADNKQKFGHTEIPNSTDDKAYVNTDARVHFKGLPLIEKGILNVTSIDNNINFIIASGLAKISRLLKGLDLHDIDWSDLDHTLTIANFHDSFINTGGYMYSICDWGGFSFVANPDIRYSHTAMFVLTIVERIFTEQGWTISGPLLSDTLYQNLMLPFSKGKWEHSDRWKEGTGFNMSPSISQNVAARSLSTQTNVRDAVVLFYPDNKWTATQAITLADVSGFIDILNFSSTQIGGSSVTPKLAILKNGVIITSTNILGNGQISVATTNLSVVANDVVSLEIVADYTVISIATAPDYSFKIIAANLFSEQSDGTINIGDTIMAEAYLPKMGQMTFLKAIMQIFGIVPDVNAVTQTIAFRFFNEISDNIGNAPDWSDKLIKPINSENFYRKKEKVGNYSRVNEMRYLDDDLVSEDTGKGQMVLEDTSLAERDTLFTLPFAASNTIQQLYLGNQIPLIQLWDLEDGIPEQQFKPKQRIVYIEKDPTRSVSINDGVNPALASTNPVPWGRFVQGGAAHNLSFSNNLISRYYGTFFSTINKGVKLTIQVNLSPIEFSNIDHFTPVYFSQFGGYYYISEARLKRSGIVELKIIRL